MDTFIAALPAIGRILIGFYFTFMGFWNIYHWRPFMNVMVQKNIPLPFLILPLGIFWQITCGTMIMFNSYCKLAALLLIPFILVGIFIFQDFWHFHGEQRRLHLSLFISHLTVSLGALLLLLNPICVT